MTSCKSSFPATTMRDEVEGQRRVHRVAERVENRGDIVADLARDLVRVFGRDADVLRERPGPVDADAARIAAQVTAPGAAITAFAAHDVSFPRHPVADLDRMHELADLFDHADVFVADGHRHGHVFLRPLVPVVDMQVGAADRDLADLDQHVLGTGLGPRHVLQPEAGFIVCLDQCFHCGLPVISSSRLPASMKASMALSICARSCAALIWVRTRAISFGTTG